MVTFGLILDMDGVILNSAIYNLLCFNFALQDYGIFIPERDFPKYNGIPLDEMVRQLEEKHGRSINFSKFRMEANNYQRKLMNGDLPDIIKGISSNQDLDNLLTELSTHKIPLAVGTSSHRNRAFWILEKLGYVTAGYSPIFDAIIVREDVRRYKPYPDTFLKAKLEIGSPDNCVVIEDSPTGIEAAKNAGMIAIAYLTKGYSKEDFNDADLVIESFVELSYQVLQTLLHDR